MNDGFASPSPSASPSSRKQPQQQQYISPHQHLYKMKDSNWKNELRKNFMRRLHDSRQKAFDRTRDGLDASRSSLLVESIIQEEIIALRLSEQTSADELNEAIEEFERFRDEIIEQEIDSMIAYERERLEDMASTDDSNLVLCPKCQHCNLNFPDVHTLHCTGCDLSVHLDDGRALPSPFELKTHFTRIFSSHADRNCPKTPYVQQEANDKVFLRCEQCAFDATII